MMTSTKTFNGMSTFETFIERFNYLKLDGQVGVTTFGHHRFINQLLYQSPEWKTARRNAIVRDNGCDLGVPGREIHGTLVVHHITPITEEDILNRNPIVFDLDNLITTSHNTHNAIHYGSEDMLITDVVDRQPGDTKLW